MRTIPGTVKVIKHSDTKRGIGPKQPCVKRTQGTTLEGVSVRQ